MNGSTKFGLTHTLKTMLKQFRLQVNVSSPNANLGFKACCENIQWCKNTCYLEVGFQAWENIHRAKTQTIGWKYQLDCRVVYININIMTTTTIKKLTCLCTNDNINNSGGLYSAGTAINDSYTTTWTKAIIFTVQKVKGFSIIIITSGVDPRGWGICALQYLTRGVAYEIIPQYCEKFTIFCLIFTNIQTKSTDFALKMADF